MLFYLRQSNHVLLTNFMRKIPDIIMSIFLNEKGISLHTGFSGFFRGNHSSSNVITRFFQSFNAAAVARRSSVNNVFLQKQPPRVFRKKRENFARSAGKHLCQILFKKQPLELFQKKGILKNFGILTGKHLCQSPFFNRVAGFSLRLSYTA